MIFRTALAADPALSSWAEDERQVARTWERSATEFPPSEDGVAQAFAAAYGGTLLYCTETGQWYIWFGTHWQPERTRLALHWARESARDVTNGSITSRASFLCQRC